VPPAKGGFPSWLAGPLEGLARPLDYSHPALRHQLTAVLVGMSLAYLVVVACARAIRPRIALLALGVLAAAVLLCPPLSLTDTFNYLIYARMGAVHGLNPYTHVTAMVRSDPAFPFSTWHHLSSPYGPIFTLATYPLALLPLPVAYWTLKAAALAAGAGCVALVAGCARRLGRRPLPAVLFVALNPAWLYYGLGGVHNDVFMLLLLLAAVYALVGRAGRAGAAASAAAVVSGVAIKLSGAVALPFALLASRRRLAAVGGAAASAAVLGAATVAAFGRHVPALSDQSSLVTPLSPLNLAGLAVGQGGVTHRVHLVAGLALVAVIAWLCVRTWRGMDWIAATGWAFVALILSLTWVMPWYAMWALPFAALAARGRLLRVVVLVLSLFVVATWLPQASAWTAALGFHPNATPVGHANVRAVGRLLH
jgi:hypothetical protein